jgi:hypothetical protein
LDLRIKRRKKVQAPTPYHEQPYTYRYALEAPFLPEPWRAIGGVYALPMEFLMPYVDTRRLSIVSKTERAHIDALKPSILSEGLREPCELLLDPTGKLRFDNGYHRLVVLSENPTLFKSIPCVVRQVNHPIKGYGRTIPSEIHALLSLLTKYQTS